MKKLIFIAFFISGLCSALFAQTDKATVEGVVRDSDGKPLSFATMFIAELGTGVSTDLEGKFRFTGTKGTEYTLNVSYLNHVDKEVKVKAGSPEPLVIVLEEQSYELAEVVVMADYKKNQGSTAVINQQALEHIQPTSVADVLSLIPGGLFRESSATGFNRISLRQSGSDDNTSLGMAVVMDGIPQDNDGFRASIPGLSTGTTAQFGGASGDAFSAICGMQISRFTSSKPSKFAFASDEKSIHQPTTSFARCYLNAVKCYHST